MAENIEQVLSQLEISETFEEQITLRTLISDKPAIELADIYVQQHFNDKLAGKTVKLKPILLIGNQSAGVHTFARSISNSLANLNFHTVSGKWLSVGAVTMHGFLGEGDEFSSYYICHGDKLNSACQRQLFEILCSEKVFWFDFEEKTWSKKEFKNRLVILSAEKKENIEFPLRTKFLKINLKPLSVDDVKQALSQRVKFLKLKTSCPNCIEKIAEQFPLIGKSMEVLGLAYRIMRSKNQDVITKEHIMKAVNLTSINTLSKTG